MDHIDLEQLDYSEVWHLPIVKHYIKQLDLVGTIDTLVDTKMQLQPGVAIMAMVLDTLSGRTPLYRLKEFYEEKDTELLLGQSVEPKLFVDYNLERVIDKIFDTGCQKIFSQIAQNAVNAFKVDTKGLHFDTTSVSVYGDYDTIDPPFHITYGYSKDKRPDLKQFLVSMLCVDRNIPIVGAPKDGNASDKSLNNELLSNISKHMARYKLKPGAFIYIADSAVVTKSNLAKADEKKISILSRLPATFSECSRVIGHAVESDNWIDIGTLAKTPATKKRPAAYYRAVDTTVELYRKTYRAIVVHSSAHDKRRHNRIDRLLDKDQKDLQQQIKLVTATPFYCKADAEAAARKLCKSTTSIYHQLNYKISEIAKYGRGRPKKNERRIPKHHEYVVTIDITQKTDTIESLRLQAGCFVLICNLTDRQSQAFSAAELLSLYKDQDGIEKNFGFLKDPAIVNSIFLKKPHRIEVLGLILLLSLLVWRLMERALRQHVESTGESITGWEDRPTKRPTSFMMTTKFISILVLKFGDQRKLARPLKPVQLEYLKALNVPRSVFTVP